MALPDFKATASGWLLEGHGATEEGSTLIWLPWAGRLPGPPLIPQPPGSCTKARLLQLPASISPHREPSSHPGPKPPDLLHQTGPCCHSATLHSQACVAFLPAPNTHSYRHTHTDTKITHASIYYSHTHIHMHLPTHTHTHSYSHIPTLSHLQRHTDTKSILMHTCSHTATHHSCTCVHRYTQTHVVTHAHLHTHVHIHTHTLTYTRKGHTDSFPYTCSQWVGRHVHTYSHTHTLATPACDHRERRTEMRAGARVRGTPSTPNRTAQLRQQGSLEAPLSHPHSGSLSLGFRRPPRPNFSARCHPQPELFLPLLPISALLFISASATERPQDSSVHQQAGTFP